MARTIAIGDIHGCLASLDALLAAIDILPGDTLVPLGDFIDRGPASRQVIDRLIKLSEQANVVPILGNHEEMMMMAGTGVGPELEFWLECGGAATLASYGGLEEVPPEHIEFLAGCRPWYETEKHLYLHAGYVPELALPEQPPDILRWTALSSIPLPHCSGKQVIVGHTAQHSGEILDAGHLICIDTYCHGGGWLTALDPESRHFWQADEHGTCREGDLE